MNENDEIILRTYNSVWKIDRKIYSIEGLKLLFPVSINEVVYFGISIIISILLIKFVPFFDKLNFVIKFIVVPFGLTKLLTTVKLDGKLPHKFMYDYIVFIASPKQYCRFKPIDSYKKIKFSTPILFRKSKIINKTDKAIKDRG
jgi:hypothetical protein